MGERWGERGTGGRREREREEGGGGGGKEGLTYGEREEGRRGDSERV